MALNLDVKILGDYKDLTKATRGARKELTQFEKATRGISKGIKGSLAGIAAGFAVGGLVDQFKTLTKAAIADNKAQATLALTMRNVVGATDDQVASVEKSISAWQTQFGILDDELRPAYQTLIGSTKDVTAANELMQIAMDAAAATGKPLVTVALALGKAANGSTTSLVRLLPSLKNSKNLFQDLKLAVQGAAQSASDTNPYMRIDAVFADIQERIGNQLLPILTSFSDWLASPEGQQGLEDFTQKALKLAEAFVVVTDKAIEAWDWLNKINPLKASSGSMTRAQARAQGLSEDMLAKLFPNTGTGTRAYDPRGFAKSSPSSSAFDWKSYFDKIFGSLPGTETKGGGGGSSTYKEPKAITRLKKNLATLKTAYTDAAKAIKESMASFQQEATSGFGLISAGDVQYFSAEKLIAQMQRVKAAATNFASNITKLKNQGTSISLIEQIIGLGAEQGGTVAQGLLDSGKLKDVNTLFNQVGTLGTGVGTAQQSMANGATQSALESAISKLSTAIDKGGRTYNIKVNNAQASAADIITSIKKYERTTGRKYLVN